MHVVIIRGGRERDYPVGYICNNSKTGKPAVENEMGEIEEHAWLDAFAKGFGYRDKARGSLMLGSEICIGFEEIMYKLFLSFANLSFISLLFIHFLFEYLSTI